MNSKFYLCDRDTMMLMPPAIQDWLPEDHLARFVADIIDQLDISDLERKYSLVGGKAYPIKMMLALIFYGYSIGVYSSRKIEQATYDSVAFRFLAANLHPDHDTIAVFRKNFSCMLTNVFTQILLIASEAGLLRLGNISIDGTKIKANASKHKALSWKYAKQLEKQLNKEITELIQKAQKADFEETENLNIPDELARREKRLVEIKRAQEEIKKRALEHGKMEEEEYKEKLERREAKKKAGQKRLGPAPKKPDYEPKDSDQVNLVDEESRIMPKSGSKSFEQSYNAQIAVEQESMLIITNHVTQNANDKQEMEPTLKSIKEIEKLLKEKFKTASADAGYFSRSNVQLCEDNDIIPLIVDKRDKHNTWLDRQSEMIPDNSIETEEDLVMKMKKRLKSNAGKKIYAKRKSTVEPVFGIIKHVMGFREFLRRGFKAAQEEWNIAAIAYNIKRLFNLGAKRHVIGIG